MSSKAGIIYNYCLMNNFPIYFRNDSAHDLGFLYSRDVTDFVHFTDLTNVPGILQSGLLPRSSLDQMGAHYVWSDDLRLDDKNAVNLSITNPNINMLYWKRKQLAETHEFVILTLAPALLADVEGSYEFRRNNAASRDSQSCSIEDLYAGDRPTYFEPSWTTDNQAEVRVWRKIDPKWIKTIQFPSDFYDRHRPEPNVQSWPVALAGLARDLGLQLEVMLCDRYFYYNNAPVRKYSEQRRCFECRVIRPQQGKHYAAPSTSSMAPVTDDQHVESGGNIAQASDTIQRAAESLSASAGELTKAMARLETKVSDASKVTATAKGEATKAEKLHRKADALLETTQTSIRGIEASIADMREACASLARMADSTTQHDQAVLDRIEALELVIGRIDRNTQRGFGKERG
ncbi:MAG: DUF4433 domain-containing protein [Atopobiaceae bacterium]|nr:DUF4433 domain-containing protein [Atopobiaceae bacterium]